MTHDPNVWDDVAKRLKPHGYWPDFEAMGDCVSCGNVHDIPEHREYEQMLEAMAPQPRRLVQKSLWP